MLRTALTLAARGLHVFPCLPRAKEPATRHGCRDATADPSLIREWWRIVPDCNIGIATGEASGIFAVDVDSTDAESALRRLEGEHGELPQTVEAITARGRHVYFRYEQDRPVRNSADDRIAAGIHVRGDGGYTLAPPSIHPSGRRYAWSVDSGKEFAAAPAWLLDRIAEHTQDKPKKTPPSVWCARVADGVGEGARNDTATKLAGYLLRYHLDAQVALELLKIWNVIRCYPPLDADEIETIVESIAGREVKRRGGNGN